MSDGSDSVEWHRAWPGKLGSNKAAAADAGRARRPPLPVQRARIRLGVRVKWAGGEAGDEGSPFIAALGRSEAGRTCGPAPSPLIPSDFDIAGRPRRAPAFASFALHWASVEACSISLADSG
jgi:hypothetical protein